MKFEKNYISRNFSTSGEVSVLSMYPPGLLHCLSSGEVLKIISVSNDGVFQVMSSSHHIFDY